MAIETSVQGWLHTFEQGRLALWVKRLLLAAAFAGVALFWVFVKFNGFSLPDAMDQAQIARQLATGQGFTTLYARPLNLRLFAARGNVPDPLPEMNNGPLGPLISAAAMRAAGMRVRVPDNGVMSYGDLIIAATGVACLVSAIIVSILLGRALFGTMPALLGAGLVVCTALVWRFAISGLPQTAMMLFFNAALLCLIRALEASGARSPKRTLAWVWAAAFLLGVVTLGNGIGLCIFGGFLIFITVALRPRLAVAAGAASAYLFPLLPWLWHNFKHTGHPMGFARFALMRPAGMDKSAFAANFEPSLAMHWTDVWANTAAQGTEQLTQLFGLLGHNIAAPAFFLAVLFLPFGRWVTAQFRWAVLLMWAGAFAGMSVAGVGSPLSPNQLHVLFLPVMVLYGFVFLFMLWERLEFELPLLRTGFIFALFAVTALPLYFSMSGRTPRFNWPPYLPLLVQKLGDWVGPGEALASDIPWATAWYSGRRSLLLPESLEQFELINSERLLGAPLVAIYLTPASAGGRTYADIVGGRYREWARVVLDEHNTQIPKSWRLRSKVNLPIDGASILLADRERWKE